MRKIIFILFIFLLSPQISRALMFSGGVGFGATTMTNEDTEKEGPLAQVWTVEYLHHSFLAFGVEHLRSMSSSLFSSASFTGVLGRYYFNAAPMARIPAERLSTDNVSMRDLCFFVGIGGGIGQSSRLPLPNGLSSNAAGVYLSPRVGVDYQLGQNLGVRLESIAAFTFVGKGQLGMFEAGASIYWLF